MSELLFDALIRKTNKAFAMKIAEALRRSEGVITVNDLMEVLNRHGRQALWGRNLGKKSRSIIQEVLTDYNFVFPDSPQRAIENLIEQKIDELIDLLKDYQFRHKHE